VMTGRAVWRDAVKFWGMLFGINFAMGVATGLPMEFQFGTNWAYYAHYVGDIFGAPLAIEGLMAFFLEATFVGLFFFGWNKLGKVQHLVVTCLLALGTNLSALWILIANGWMQHPVGARFNAQTMRMEVTDFAQVIFNPVAQAKFVHTVSAGYVTGAMFVMAISAFYLLKGKHRDIAARSLTVAASFGLASALSVVVLGDESGYTAGENQKMKVAAIEAVWNTEKAPASLTIVGLPDQKAQVTRSAIRVPWALGLVVTRSVTGEVPGINQLVAANESRIRSGIVAYGALSDLRAHRGDASVLNPTLDAHVNDLGFALLLKRYTPAVIDATPQQIHAAALDTVPQVAPLFWSFRVMAGLGFYFIGFFAWAFWIVSRRRIEASRWFLRIALWSLPLPWVAAEVGWYVAEAGRQPWTIDGILPTALSASSVPAANVMASLTVFAVFYSLLAIIELTLMVRAIRSGPGARKAEPARAAIATPELQPAR
jgi:cytochrome d ubiquinol oxidase subunit I